MKKILIFLIIACCASVVYSIDLLVDIQNYLFEFDIVGNGNIREKITIDFLKDGLVDMKYSKGKKIKYKYASLYGNIVIFEKNPGQPIYFIEKKVIGTYTVNTYSMDTIYNLVLKEKRKKSTKNTTRRILLPVDNSLRLRQSPSIDGIIIRKLKELERLEIIEKGKTETINGTIGNWVKVSTEKGEEGWCFDAYLAETFEEVKEEPKK